MNNSKNSKKAFTALCFTCKTSQSGVKKGVNVACKTWLGTELVSNFIG